MLELIHDELIQLQTAQTDDETAEPNGLPDETGNMPLSALFREKSHQDLRQKIESWRSYLIDDDTAVDPLPVGALQPRHAREHPPGTLPGEENVVT